MLRTVFIILISILVVAGLVWLQIRLSHSKSRIPGLIMPAISFLYSLLLVFNLAAYDGTSILAATLQILLVLLIGNLPTYILLGIYFACRSEIKRNRAMEKMNIKDL
ncbi:MAG: hypothetical protein AB7D36_06815 [Oscillospiraceae bacterium]